MFGSADKALVAIVMGVLFIVTALFGEGWWSHATEEVVIIVIGFLTPVFVWLVPNRE
jgi:hypothetical protein